MANPIHVRVEKTNNSRLSEFDENNLEFGRQFSDHMFIADFDGEKWTDHRVVPFAPMEMHPANLMMHYGQSIFEGLKAFKSAEGEVLVFRPEKNAERMVVSAERMCMAPFPVEDFMAGLTQLLDIDRDWVPSVPGSSMYIRPFMIAYDNYLGVKASKTYRFMIICSPSGPYYSKPVSVKIETDFARASKGGTGFAKAAGNYAASLYPAKLANESGYDQLIWTDAETHEYIEEAGTMNVLFRIGNKIITSGLYQTILPGVTRDAVLQIAKDWGYEVEEKRVSVKEIVDAAKSGELKEAFGAGTAATIIKIKNIAFDGVDYALPEFSEDDFSTKVYDYMDEMKRGAVEDKFNWIVTV